MIGLLCATPRELETVIPLLADTADSASPSGTRLVRGRAGGSEVLAFSAGIGKVSAAAGARFLIDRFTLHAMLVFGMAGALSPLLQVGDLVIADVLVPADVGVAHSGGYHTTGPGQCENGRLVFCPSFEVPPSMLRRVHMAAEDAGLPYRLGKVLTCDQIVLEPELRSHLGEAFGALAVEMEGAAVAQVAATEGLPFAAVRAISDELSHDFVGFERLLEYRGQARRNIWHNRFRLAVSGADTVARAREMSRGRDAALASLGVFLRSFLAEPG
ncbi:MAG: 5'-methylthioadenosine/S-adenosylhomocysteine nucleosidase [Actinomycetota bacterium]